MPLGPADGSFTTVSAAVLCLASCGCLVAGAVYLQWGLESQRTALRVAFDGAVDKWPGAREEFRHLQVTANVTGKVVTLAPDSAMDAWHDAEGFAPVYGALVFRRAGSLGSGAPSSELGEMQLQAQSNPAEQRTAVGGLTSVTWSLAGAPLLTQAFPLLRARVRHERSGFHKRCGPRTGVNVNGDCWAFSRLSRVCIQVAPASSGGSWRLAPRLAWQNESYGCDFASGSWAVAEYRPLRVVRSGHSGEGWPTGLVSFDDLVIEVRSRADPYFAGLELTAGTLSFGLSAQEEDVTGVVLLLVGFCLLLPVLLACLSRRAKELWHPAGRHHRSPGRFMKRRQLDAETVGMRYAVDMAECHLEDARGLERAIEWAGLSEEPEASTQR